MIVTLQTLQQQLQTLYELEVQYNVFDFLITDKNISRKLDNSFDRNIREKLYLYEESGDLGLSLYLDHEIIEHLAEDDPTIALHEGNIDDTCLALEGISHFLYLVWNVTYERNVSLLEMEIQAEVDKFIMISSWLDVQSGNNFSDDLQTLLFEKISYHQSLTDTELERYKTANFYAAKYCNKLRKLFSNRIDGRIFLNEIRKFYRMTRSGKMQRINCM